MLSEFGIAKRAWSRWAAVVLATAFTACIDDSVAPSPEDETKPPAAPRVLGFVELTFDGIGTPELSSSVISAPTLKALDKLRAQRDRSGDLRDFAAQDLTLPADTPSGGNGTIQLAFEHFNPQTTIPGLRYVSATFNVRNAQMDSMPYNTARTNLTFLAVSRPSNVNGTAVTRLLLGNGSPAPAELALQVLPSDLVTSPDGQTLVVEHPDVLQILRESEVAALPLPTGLTTAFPYGFVVRRADNNNTTRTLPASPTPLEFAGVVDFAFSIPQQPTQDQDPQTISVLLLAVDDSETLLTQGPQEQDATDRLALQKLDSTLHADTVTLLPGGTLPGVSGLSGLRTICSVRTAGMPGSATAHLVNVPESAFQSFSPNPYATNGSASHIPNNTSFQAAFNTAVDGAGPTRFTVRGLQSGTAFSDTTYSGNGTTTITTPVGSFRAGEEIEIALTNTLSCPRPAVARYRVQSAAATGSLSPHGGSGSAFQGAGFALGDLRGNGTLDVIVADAFFGDIEVLLGNGDGTFSPSSPPSFGVGTNPNGVAIGDLNGNDTLDVVTANSGSSDISVLLGNGDGTFSAPSTPTFGVGANPSKIALGDLNGNGILDVVTANRSSNNVSVLLGNGDGTFQNDTTFPVGATGPNSIAIADMNGDGILDAVTANGDSHDVSVLLGNGDGTFQSPLTSSSLGASNSPVNVVIGDLNGNGTPDVVVANDGSGSFNALLGTGSGTLVPQDSIPTGAIGGPSAVAVGDLTGNDTADVVTVNVGQIPGQDVSTISVLRGNGNGTSFQPPDKTNIPFATEADPPTPIAVLLGDLRGIGVLDVIVLHDSSADPSVAVLLGETPP